MSSPADLISKWPLLRQMRERKDGTGLESMSEKTRSMHARTDDAKVARSICPYCGVGWALTLHVQENRIVKVSSPVASSVTNGQLCVKGRFGFSFVQNTEPRK